MIARRHQLDVSGEISSVLQTRAHWGRQRAGGRGDLWAESSLFWRSQLSLPFFVSLLRDWEGAENLLCLDENSPAPLRAAHEFWWQDFSYFIKGNNGQIYFRNAGEDG